MVSAIMKVKVAGFCHMRTMMVNKESTLPGLILKTADYLTSRI